jgi:hypothetical protein
MWWTRPEAAPHHPEAAPHVEAPPLAPGADARVRRDAGCRKSELFEADAGSDAEHVDRIALLLLAAGDVHGPAERLRIGVQLAAMLPGGALPIIGEAMERAVEMRRVLDGGQPSAPGTTTSWN